MTRLTQMAANFASLPARPIAIFALIFISSIALCIGGCARRTCLNRVDILDPMAEVPGRCFITPQYEIPSGPDKPENSHSQDVEEQGQSL